jgi:sterol desaturase/sphingolipid hydroxylase (fatty acid hydroxylase superfamily)
MVFKMMNEADIFDGIQLSVTTLAMTIVLELTSIPTIRGLCKQQGGTRLYIMGLAMNVINLATSSLTYAIAVPILCTPEPRGPIASLFSIAALVTTQAVLYCAGHRLMHTKHFYWMHRFHHRFNKYVPPSAANAVSMVEFNLAYSSPFIVGGILFAPDRWVLKVAISINYVGSALVHTPWLQSLSRKLLPWFLVSTHDHMEHHRLLNSHYASPTINVDRLVEWLFAERRLPPALASRRGCGSKTPRTPRTQAEASPLCRN